MSDIRAKNQYLSETVRCLLRRIVYCINHTNVLKRLLISSVRIFKKKCFPTVPTLFKKYILFTRHVSVLKNTMLLLFYTVVLKGGKYCTIHCIISYRFSSFNWLATLFLHYWTVLRCNISRLSTESQNLYCGYKKSNVYHISI